MGGSMGHLPPNLINDSGGFLTSSLSAAALNHAAATNPGNQPSCAVPMHMHHSNSVTSTPGGGGWVSSHPPHALPPPGNGTTSGTPARGQLFHHHQEQCPHYNSDYKFAEAPS